MDSEAQIVFDLSERLTGPQLLNVFFKLGLYIAVDTNADTLSMESKQGARMDVTFTGVPKVGGQ